MKVGTFMGLRWQAEMNRLHLIGRMTFRNSPILFTAGDSHSRVVLGTPGTEVLHFGAVTLHRLSRPGELVCLLARSLTPVPRLGLKSALHFIRPSDSLVVFAGEIDVRVHFQRAVRTDPIEYTHALAKRFAQQIQLVNAITGARVAIASITPPIYGNGRQETELPINGTFQQRIEWTRMMNQALADSGAPFVDCFDAYADSCGALRGEVVDETVHIRLDCNTAVIESLSSAGLFQGSIPTSR